MKFPKNMNQSDKSRLSPHEGIKSSMLDGPRQLLFPEEFRIPVPSLILDASDIDERDMQQPPLEKKETASKDSLALNQLVVEFANCLWYLKTKHFKMKWEDTDTGDDDPRVRRALSRLSKSIERLKESGIEIYDPTNKRYPQGGEGMMRPIQFLPTAGLTFEVVNETVTPIIYRDDKLIQRGEVFVAVPIEEKTAATAATEPLVTDASVESRPSDVDTQIEKLPAEENLATGRVEVADSDNCKDSSNKSKTKGDSSKLLVTDDEITYSKSTEKTNMPAEPDTTITTNQDEDSSKDDSTH